MAAAAQSNLNFQGEAPAAFKDVLPDPRTIENLPTRFRSLAEIVATVFNIVIGISGAIFMVLLLIGGIQYMTAAGNEENTTKSKKLLVDAVIGLVLTLSAWAIGTFILRQFYLPTSGVLPRNESSGAVGGRNGGTGSGGQVGSGGGAVTSGTVLFGPTEVELDSPDEQRLKDQCSQLNGTITETRSGAFITITCKTR